MQSIRQYSSAVRTRRDTLTFTIQNVMWTYVSQTTSECGLSDRSQLVFERHLTPFTPVPITVRLWSEIAHKKTEANTGNKMVKYCFGNCNVENNSMHNWLGAGSFHFQAFNFRQSTISFFFPPPSPPVLHEVLFNMCCLYGPSVPHGLKF